LFAAACGGSDAEVTSSTPEPSVSESPDTSSEAGDGAIDATTTTEDVGGEPADQPEVGESGSFAVNGEEFTVTLLNRCIPFFDEPGNIDLQALAQGAQLNLTVLSGMLDVSVQGSSVEEMFGSIAFASDFLADGFEVSNDRFTGSATVSDALGSGETVDLTWDVMVPSEIRDCSL
jgi:hypothetical protein